MDTPPASLFTDGQIIALVSGLVAAAGTIAGVIWKGITWSVNRLVGSLDAMTGESKIVRETLVAVTHELREARDDVAELKTAKGSGARKRDTPVRTPPIGIRRAPTDTDS